MPWTAHHEHIAALLGKAKTVLAYNAGFDRRLIAQSARRLNLRPPGAQWRCLMLDYAEHRGELHPWRDGKYRWHKLDAAARYEGVRLGSQSHRALALMSAVARDVPEWTPEEPDENDFRLGCGVASLLLIFGLIAFAMNSC